MDGAAAERPILSTAKRRKKKNRQVLPSATRLHHFRPSTKPATPLPSAAGRALIRTHHTLHKRLTTAQASRDESAVSAIRAEIDSSGGLSRYQDASLAGQSKERGGDTSGVLVSWLSSFKNRQSNLKMLEVGALSVDNACAGSGLFKGGITRIDLQSRHSEIETQDFMQRPLPESDEQIFDVVSLSLVVNFVGDPLGRGNMLRRVDKFLKRRPSVSEEYVESTLDEEDGTQRHEEADSLLPALFLVLPAPCVLNSRYLDEKRLEAIMQALGYELVRRKMSAKLLYQLWKHDGLNGRHRKGAIFKKEEIRTGKERNNFAIVLR